MMMKINSFAVAKTTFFKNALNPGAVFPPDGMYMYMYIYIYMYMYMYLYMYNYIHR